MMGEQDERKILWMIDLLSTPWTLKSTRSDQFLIGAIPEILGLNMSEFLSKP
jgi:hypothetical protein